ncbi:unnamed protein product [Ectocarpus sp. CCAP 1310/34]|nr:unnamed protein product [Ectocarpus sp. CCAP 1310/34]
MCCIMASEVTGNPSIVLGMCRDYWDGSAISNLPATLRKTILDMHQQWSLEDLDVVAFAYVPVPYTVNPFISSFNKHPDYLIHLSQGQASSSGKGRSTISGGGGGGSRAGASPVISPLPSSSPQFRGADCTLGIISETCSTHQQGHHNAGGDVVSSGTANDDDPNSKGAEGPDNFSPPFQEGGGATKGRAQRFQGSPDRGGSPSAGAVAAETTSDGAESSAEKGQQSSVIGAARQCSSANSSPVRSKLMKAIAEEPGFESGSEKNYSQGEDGEPQGKNNDGLLL